MYIKSLNYEDRSTNWKLAQIEFKSLTLLVGASGVGKTQILKALLNLKKISRGKSLSGLKWEVELKTSSGHECRWLGVFENKGFTSGFISRLIDDEEDEKDKPCVEREELSIDGKIVVSRDVDGIIFNDSKTVKLSQKESVISLLKEEDQIKDIHDDFKRILFDNNAGDSYDMIYFDNELELKAERYKDIASIRSCDENIKTKLFFLYKNQKQQFKELVESFVDIFPHVDDMKIEPITSEYGKRLPSFFREVPVIQIKEKNVLHWIDELKISSGMLRTLMHIAELFLCADDTLILIDEFENSLGVNCINQITRSILDSERNLQFIITSHHPYIINDIDCSYWKVVTRKGGLVTASDAKELGVGRSKHQAFTQLANLTAYSEGIEI